MLHSGRTHFDVCIQSYNNNYLTLFYNLIAYMSGQNSLWPDFLSGQNVINRMSFPPLPFVDRPYFRNVLSKFTCCSTKITSIAHFSSSLSCCFFPSSRALILTPFFSERLKTVLPGLWIYRIFKAFLDYGGISPCAAVSIDFSSHTCDLLFYA